MSDAEVTQHKKQCIVRYSCAICSSTKWFDPFALDEGGREGVWSLLSLIIRARPFGICSHAWVVIVCVIVVVIGNDFGGDGRTVGL